MVDVTWWSVDLAGLERQGYRRLDELLASPSDASARQRSAVAALLGGARARQPIKRALEIPASFNMTDFGERLERWCQRARIFKKWVEAAAEGPGAAAAVLDAARILSPRERDSLGDWLRPPGTVRLSPTHEGAGAVTRDGLRRLHLAETDIDLGQGHVLFLDGPYAAELVITARLAVRGREDPMWPWRGVDPLPGAVTGPQNEAVDWAAWHGRRVLEMLSWLPVSGRFALLSLAL